MQKAAGPVNCTQSWTSFNSQVQFFEINTLHFKSSRTPLPAYTAANSVPQTTTAFPNPPDDGYRLIEGGIGALEHPNPKTCPTPNPFIADKPTKKKQSRVEELLRRGHLAELKPLAKVTEGQSQTVQHREAQTPC